MNVDDDWEAGHGGEVMPNPAKDQWDHQRRMERQERRRQEYRRGLRPFAIAVWEITKEHNLGSLVRTAHAAAAAEVLLVGGREWDSKPACTSDLFTPVVRLPDMPAFSSHIRERGYSLVAVELHDRAVNLFEAEYPLQPCFLLGTERGGIPEDLLEQADTIIQIPQWGLVPSLNLAIAGSIVVYDFLAKLHHRDQLDRPHGGLVVD